MFASRSRMILAVLVAAGFAASLEIPFSAQTPRILALVGGMLLDGYEAPPIQPRGGAHRRQQDRAESVPRPRSRSPPTRRSIDTSGLHDDAGDDRDACASRDHRPWRLRPLVSRGSPSTRRSSRLETVLEISAKQLLMAGITSAIDLGGSMEESLACAIGSRAEKCRDRACRSAVRPSITAPVLRLTRPTAGSGARASRPGRGRRAGDRRSHHGRAST